MKRTTAIFYASLQTKRHESTIQELRHERKAEEQRLDGLKKILQTKINSGSVQAGPVRVA